MKRRSFLTTATLASAGLTSLLITGCTSSTKKDQDLVPANVIDTNFELEEETIASLGEKLASGKYTSEQLVQLYLKRIEAVDKNGAQLNSVIEINPDAIAIAVAMDKESKAGKSRGPLHGIPVLIKDNIDTADKMQTTAGSLAMVGNIASKDAFVVRKLREAGAVIIGKTNLSEWANFRSTQSSSGWSSRGGQTKNPFILDHNPCGSSAGSGAAVSANLCVVAIGTETDGSIVCPASVNGIVGIKPTVGLVSRSGIIPISKTQDTAGPMARTVSDAAILLGAIVAIDQDDAITLESKGKNHKDYTLFLDVNALKGKRIGVEKKPQGNNKYINALLDNAISVLKQQGAVIVEIDYIEKINAFGEAEFEVLQYEFKDGLNSYLAIANAKVKNLKEVIDFNIKNEDKAMPYFKQETLESSNAKKGLADTKYLEALNLSFEGSKRILGAVFEENKLDAITGITMGPACSIDVIYGDRWGGYSLTSPAAISGFPHITVPCGQVYELPVGLSFFGTPYKEGELIGLGYAYEQASKKRVKPELKASFL
ncbi:amidase [Flavobacterium fryxellicola]|uniref:Amidase n=1 Tax=Flavobacterium fryxellicola TaxID=249352 RepID=A0A167WUY6_9FLAO|nr:amidase [Flavobacterium fryxellicola]OAB27768.1 amidase [Flavobacterium fryxellicola]SHN78748.1 amidase [Flavobacterium fryxellicola]